MKPGVLTSEFYVTIVFALLAVLGTIAGTIKDPALGTIAVAAVSAAYAIARGLAKSRGVDVPPANSELPK